MITVAVPVLSADLPGCSPAARFGVVKTLGDYEFR